MPITMLYAGALALVFLVLSYRVIQARGSQKVFMGDGGDALVLRRMRGQANFAEYVPLALLLAGLLELRGTAGWVLHSLLGALLVGRLLHAYSFGFSMHFVPGRFVGTLLTWGTLGTAAVLCLWQGFRAL
jgi:uncharacterized protein